jgi:putative integral membrane protein (TIGR02587 family)
VNTWKKELTSFARAFAGAFIFGVPLLFTMEMWWIGEYIDYHKLMLFLAAALVANLGLVHVAGFKREHTLGSTVNQAFDAVAVGLVSAAVVLTILNQIRPEDPLESILGRIALQAVPLSIGASVANQVFGTHGERSRNGGENGDPPLNPAQALASDVGATAVGGIFVGFSVAPTEEIPMLAAALSYWHLLALVGFSLLISFVIVFASDFDEPAPDGPFQRPFTETMLAYLVSLVVAFGLLYLFDQVTLGEPAMSIVEQTLVLAVPTTIGGAAGRLVV